MRTLLKGLAASLVTCALLAAASGILAASARSAHTQLIVHFELPGGDTECEMVDPKNLNGNVTCGIHRNRFTCVGPTCDRENAFSRRWSVTVDGAAYVGWNRRPMPSGLSSWSRVLRPGQSVAVGYFRCTSRTAGLTCVSRRSGHGFFLSSNNKNQRLF